MKFTHKGWFGFCPVYLANLETDSPVVHERHKFLLPLFILSELFFGGYFFIRTSLQPDFIPEWPITVTGEING